MVFSLNPGHLNPPPAPEVVEGLSGSLGVSLPRDFLEFLLQHDGGEGFIGDSYIVFWRAEDLANFNLEYEVERYAPGILLFGDDGGGEGYGFDTRSASMPIVTVPFIGMDRRYVTPVATNISDLFVQLAGPI